MSEILHVRLVSGVARAPLAPTSAPPLPRDFADLNDAFATITRLRADHPAIVVEDAIYSYRWLADASALVSEGLRRQLGFRRGGNVALLCGNSQHFVAGFFGILLAGGVAVPLPPDAERDRLTTIFQRCEVDVVLATGDLPQRTRDLIGPAVCEMDLDRAPASGAAFASPAAADPALILWSSGTSGDPKGIVLSHANVLANALSICRQMEITSRDRSLALLPFPHAAGHMVMQTHILAGGVLVLGGSALFPNSLVEMMRRHEITNFSGVPEIFRAILGHSDLGGVPLSHLRFMATMGDAMPIEQRLELARRIAPAELYCYYGQSEATARLAWAGPKEWPQRPDVAGRAIDGVTLEVVDQQGHPLPPNQLGELRARGPNVMLGYWRDSQATAQVLRGGWLYTGDLAIMDEEGYVQIRGRTSALMKLAGHLVHPAEIETFVRRRLDVQQVAAVPCEIDAVTRRVALFIEPKAGDRSLTVGKVRQVCRAGLPAYADPIHVELLPCLPLNSAMKIDRVALQRRADRRETTGLETTCDA